MSDQTADAITRALVAESLWRHDAELEITRDGSRLTVRAFFPERRQSDRDSDRHAAAQARQAMIVTLQPSHHVRFSDALFYERGKRGWAVIVRAVG